MNPITNHQLGQMTHREYEERYGRDGGSLPSLKLKTIAAWVIPSGIPSRFATLSAWGRCNVVQALPNPRARKASISDQAAGRIEPYKVAWLNCVPFSTRPR